MSAAPVELLVEEDDERRSYGHQEDDPRVRRAKLSRRVDAPREDAGDRTDECSAQKTVDEELYHLYAAGPDLK